MACDVEITRIADLTMRLIRAARLDLGANGDRTSAAVKAAGVELVQEQLDADRRHLGVSPIGEKDQGLPTLLLFAASSLRGSSL